MVLYKLKRPNQEIIELNVVNRVSNDSSNQILVYESPGSNGGFVINTGRNNKKLVLTGTLLASITLSNARLGVAQNAENARAELNLFTTKMNDIKDNGEIVEIQMPIRDNSVGKWVIGRFSYDIPEGSAAYVNFTLELVEYRQVNFNTTVENLIGGEVVKKMIEKQKEIQTENITS